MGTITFENVSKTFSGQTEVRALEGINLAVGEGEFVVRERLANLLAGLDPAIFRRVHRSHVVNLDHVKKRLPWFGGDALLIMSNGCRLTQSRTFRHALDDIPDASRLA